MKTWLRCATVMVCASFVSFNAQAQSDDRRNEYTADWKDCKIFTDAVQEGNSLIVGHKVQTILAWVKKLNDYRKARNQPTFDLTSTAEQRSALFKDVFARCIADPSGEVSDKTVTIYKIQAAMNGVIIGND